MKRWKIILPTLLATSGLPLVSLVGCGNKISVTGVSIEQGDEVYCEMNGSIQLTAIVNPTDATDKGVTWSVDGSGKASVNAETGLVSGISSGDATVTVTTKDGGYTDSIIVHVITACVTSLEISKEQKDFYVEHNRFIEYTYEPSDATIDPQWSTSDTSVAEINESTGEISLKKEGTTTITLIDKITQKSDTFDITVRPKKTADFWFQKSEDMGVFTNAPITSSQTYTLGLDKMSFDTNWKANWFNFIDNKGSWAHIEPTEIQIVCDEYTLNSGVDYYFDPDREERAYYFTDAGKEKFQNCSYLLMHVRFGSSTNALCGFFHFDIPKSTSNVSPTTSQ